MPYDDMISRGSPSDPLVPEPVSQAIMQELPTQSAILQMARRVTMSAKTQRMPVLDVLPQAYWVGGGDTGLKQTSSMEWKGVTLTAEELAVIVPIPEAYLDDAQVPVWDEVRPRLVEAIGAKIDGAALFGANKPTTWPTGIVPAAVAAGNNLTLGTGPDIAHDVTKLGEQVATDGYTVKGFVARPGLKWRLLGLRADDNTPIYQQNLSGPISTGLYGYPMPELDNGAWDDSQAEILGGDFGKAILGLRSDITFKMFTEGVISDDSGAVVLNLMQQDAQAMRVTMRVAFATANPVTALNGTSGTRYPFAVIEPEGS
ncbi:phage major capsid protein [Streptomonospora litoralis]|uniref:Phage capsid family protein n=1 Tax=Streptomonospora litoralis TaxID=2498135 RepID=A0A4P6Q3F8_9ACTN|nr:phage major capsid protein [Streptomonospora litoralis]QBI53429.1 Phage capsid family protein [Streptomonospora litoralis]